MTRYAPYAALAALLLAGCGASEPPPPEKTVFGDLIKDKRVAKERVEQAQQQHTQALREAGAAGDPAGEPEGGKKP